MKITPISFSGKYYDFFHNDPRKKHAGFKLGMPDDEVVRYPQTAKSVREEYIKALYPNYNSLAPDDEVIGRYRRYSGIEHNVTAGDARDEILKEEMAQKRYETPRYFTDFGDCCD